MNQAIDETLDQVVRDALVRRKGDWAAVVQGSGVSYSWLSKFVNGHIDNPGYATLRDLRRYLLPDDAPSNGPAPDPHATT